MIGLAVLAAFGHRPGFGTEPNFVFEETVLSQVEYRYSGTYTFDLHCPKHGTTELFWEVVTAQAGAVHVHVSGDLFDKAQLSFAEPYLQENRTAGEDVTTLGCPFKRYREPFTASEVQTVVRYGSHPCTEGQTAKVEVTSAVPFGFVVGEDETLSKLRMERMPYYYAKVGKVFLGLRCPWTWALLGWGVWALLVPTFDVHQAILVGWLIFIATDLHRLGIAIKTPAGSTCPMHGNAAGPLTHPDTDAGTNALWTVHFGFRILFLQIICGVFPLWMHVNRRSVLGRITVVTLAGLTAALSWTLAAGGLGLYPIVCFIYYIRDEYKGSRRFTFVYYSNMNVTL